MQRVTEGFTIVEVMIVMAVSVVLVGISMTFLSGKDGHERFTQSMRDMQSKMQSWLDDVSNGSPYGVTTSYYCHTGGLAVQIDNRARPANSSPDCIFLGKAVQFVDAPDTNVYVYSVFGKRVGPTGDLAANISETGTIPAAATGSGSTGTGTGQLTEVYSLGPGTTVKSVTTSTGVSPAGKSHIAGFYLSLNTDQAIGSNGETNLKAYQYNIGNSAGLSSQAIGCIDSQTCGLVGNEPPILSDWEICFQNDSNSDTAVLKIRSNGGLGVSTQLEYKVC